MTTLGGLGRDEREGIAVEIALFRNLNICTSDSFGNLYVVCSGKTGQVVRKIRRDGIVTTIAGSGSCDPRYSSAGTANGNSARATDVCFLGTSALAIDAAGNLYIAGLTPASTYNQVRRVSATGVISTVAGGGPWDFLGDGGPATRASLMFPVGLAVDASGNLYISDSGEGMIRKVSPNSIISTVAGCDRRGPKRLGDGGPARGACLVRPEGVAVDSASRVFIADSGQNRVRMVSGDGIITTIAGTGRPGAEGDGGPATSATLTWPSTIVVGSRGEIYVKCVGLRNGSQGDMVRRLTPVQ